MGWDDSIFSDTDGKVCSFFRCSICLSTASEPLITSCCHIYCSECIPPSCSKCPYCRTEKITFSSLKEGNPPLYRMYGEIEVRCANRSSLGIEACSWVGSLCDFRRHLIHDCMYETEMCEECGVTIKKVELEEHRRSAAKTHKLIADKVESRLRLFLDSEVRLNKMEDTLKSIRSDFVHHLESLSHLLSSSEETDECSFLPYSSKRRRKFPSMSPIKGPITVSVKMAAMMEWFSGNGCSFTLETPALFVNKSSIFPKIFVSLQSDGCRNVRVALFADKGDSRTFTTEFSLSVQVVVAPFAAEEENVSSSPRSVVQQQLPITIPLCETDSESDFSFSAHESRFLFFSIPEQFSESIAIFSPQSQVRLLMILRLTINKLSTHRIEHASVEASSSEDNQISRNSTMLSAHNQDPTAGSSHDHSSLSNNLLFNSPSPIFPSPQHGAQSRVLPHTVTRPVPTRTRGYILSQSENSREANHTESHSGDIENETTFVVGTCVIEEPLIY
eukprot:GDKJ01060828.1.p1 GENE.GDKJ01060828.1~~GDKJ01060828.1.p1  ORF type:complete len:502 (+),score=33.48 GDKJ01060828.1:28-1533(+)